MLTKLIARLSGKRVERASQAYVDSLESVLNHLLQTIPKHAGATTEVLLKHRKDLEAAYKLLQPVFKDLSPVLKDWAKDLDKAHKYNFRKTELLWDAVQRIFKTECKDKH
mgnify:CR=1 FL=1